MHTQFLLRQPLVGVLLVLASGLAVLPADAGTPGTPLGSVATLSTGGGYPSIARDASGNFVAVWTSSYYQPAPHVLARLFAGDGTPLTAEFAVENDPVSDFQSEFPPAVTMNDAGDFVVSWIGAVDALRIDDHIYAQAYAAGGTPRGGRIDVAPVAHMALQNYADLSPPAVAMQANGSFVVAWISNSQFSPTGGFPAYNSGTVYARRYAPDATPLGAAATVVSLKDVGPLREPLERSLRIAMSSAGDYAVVWAQSVALESLYGAQQPLTSPFHARFYSAAGVPAGLPVNLPIAAADLKYLAGNEFAATRIGAGELLLAWATDDSFKQQPVRETLYLRRYSTLGLPLAAASTVATRGTHAGFYSQQRSLVLAPALAGGVVFAWLDYDGWNYAQYFSANGLPQGARFPVAESQSFNIDALTDVNGNLLAAWDRSGPGLIPDGNRAQWFQGP